MSGDHTLLVFARLSTVLVLGCYGAAVSAQSDMPSMGLLFNTKENHSLVFDCKRAHAETLQCEFTQVSVRKKANAADTVRALVEARAQFKKEPIRVVPKDCASFREVEDALAGRKSVPKQEHLAAMTALERADLTATMKALVAYCAAPTEENYLQIVRADQAKKEKSCSVSSNRFAQTFRRGEAPVAGVVSWLVQPTPSGPCGIVQLGRFESEPSKLSSDIRLWRYVARKAITNPAAEWFPGRSCSELDQAEYTYDWRSREAYVGCAYIEFSPI